MNDDITKPIVAGCEECLRLVRVLPERHQRGRHVTGAIARHAGATPDLVQALRSFGRMYRPHAALEDAVLVLAVRDVVGRAAHRELGEPFEEREHQTLVEHGFAGVVREIAGLDQTLGIHNRAYFTAP